MTRHRREMPHDPLWAQVLADLRDRLSAGEFSRAFPSDRELIAHYGVSRHTVREAVRRLQGEGVLERHKGRGSFVRPVAVEQQIGPLYSLFRSIEAQGHTQTSRVLDRRRETAPEVARRMSLPADTVFICLRRLRLVDGAPFAVDEVWLPDEIAGTIMDADFAHTALYIELERATGLRPLSGWERIRPALPTPEERRMLDIPARSAVFVIQRFTESAAGPLEWRNTVVRGDSYTFLTTWSDTDGPTNYGLIPLNTALLARD